MPTPMPGHPSDEIYVHPNNLHDLADKLESIDEDNAQFIQDRLAELGRQLVPTVRANTPKASGKLAESTDYRVIQQDFHDSASYQLEIYQDVRNRPRFGTRRFPGTRTDYPYWQTVHHGLQPRGRLVRVFPPSINLVEWMMQTQGMSEEQAIQESFALARHISKQGIPPNSYLEDSLRTNMQLLQEAANDIGQSIRFNLSNLPDVDTIRTDPDGGI